MMQHQQQQQQQQQEASPAATFSSTQYTQQWFAEHKQQGPRAVASCMTSSPATGASAAMMP
ncbi:hypothetical protein RSW31_25430, partial [Escherichia coli]|nr:hypothetical protein [Escherichia coli]